MELRGEVVRGLHQSPLVYALVDVLALVSLYCLFFFTNPC